MHPPVPVPPRPDSNRYRHASLNYRRIPRLRGIYVQPAAQTSFLNPPAFLLWVIVHVCFYFFRSPSYGRKIESRPLARTRMPIPNPFCLQNDGHFPLVSEPCRRKWMSVSFCGPVACASGTRNPLKRDCFCLQMNVLQPYALGSGLGRKKCRKLICRIRSFVLLLCSCACARLA